MRLRADSKAASGWCTCPVAAAIPPCRTPSQAKKTPFMPNVVIINQHPRRSLAKIDEHGANVVAGRPEQCRAFLTKEVGRRKRLGRENDMGLDG